MLSKLITRQALLAFIFLLSACGSFQKNPPLASYDANAGYRFAQLDQGSNSDELFIILAFSGGGTRAAALSYGVLEALRETRIRWQGREVSLLSEVDVISSISGGSFPAAYYGLRGAKTFDEFPERFLYRPIETELMKLALTPTNWLTLAGSTFGRSDLAAAYYDREIFNGATYQQLIAKRERPFVILNSTDMTLGTQFSFIQDQFDLLCSDLAGVPLSRAAAASSAFPGGLTPLTFANYSGSCTYQQPAWVAMAVEEHQSRENARRTARAEQRLSYTDSSPRRDFIHLIDGGVADNLGLREPLTALTSVNNSWSVLRMMNQGKVKKVAVIVVNAATDPISHRDQTPSVPGLIDTISTAATVPLDNFTFDTLELLRADAERNKKDALAIAGCKRLAAAKGEQCTLDIPAPQKIDFFQIEVAFDYIQNKEERKWYKNLPTTLELPRETVDKLRAMGKKLLNEDPQFKNLLESIP
ncbi:MAG: patatin-like phospholipase family protein [Undibacterium sp.]|nr:patatin-like phospholipase family protein [Undibacterium sp.]